MPVFFKRNQEFKAKWLTRNEVGNIYDDVEYLTVPKGVNENKKNSKNSDDNEAVNKMNTESS